MAEKKLLNGLDVEAIESALGILGGQPQASRAPKASRVRWTGGLKFKAQVRNHVFLIDEPTHLTGDDESPNSVEYVLGAYGSCVATGFVWNATRRGVTIYNLEVVLDSTQDNAFTFLGIDPADKGHSGLDEIKVKLFVQADAGEKTIREIWEHTLKTSPVGNSLSRVVAIKPEVEIIP
jgi:uncharacterized OsmC-like protein